MRCCEIRFGSLAGSNGDRRMVGIDDHVGPFQPCDSVILFPRTAVPSTG